MANYVNYFSKVQGKAVRKEMHTIKEFTSTIANDVKAGNYTLVRKLAASLNLDMFNAEVFLGVGNKQIWAAQKLEEAEKNLQGYRTEEEIKSSKEFALLSSKNRMFEMCRNFLPCFIKQSEEAAAAAKQAAAAAVEAKQAAKQAAAEAEEAKKEAAEAAAAATTEEGVAKKEQKQAEAKAAAAAAEAAAEAAKQAAAAAAAAASAGSLRFAKEQVIGYRINSLTEEEAEKYKNSASWKELTLQVGKEFADTLQYYVLASYDLDFKAVQKQRKKAFTEISVGSVYYIKNDKLYTMKEQDFIDFDTLFSVLSYAVQDEREKAKQAAAAAAVRNAAVANAKDAEAAKQAEYEQIAANLAKTLKLEETAINFPALKKQVQAAEEIAAKFAIKASEEAAAAVAAAADYVAKKLEEKKQKQAAKRAEAKKQAEAAAEAAKQAAAADAETAAK